MNTEKGVARGAALLTISEVGLGSLLHGFHLPLSGEILSLNQIGILSAVARENRGADERFTEVKVSSVAALLKSISPAGKKLTPMLAITVQGLLFNLGTFFFGRGAVGLCIGGAISGLWSFVQPLLLYLILYGADLFEIGKFYFDKLDKLMILNRRDLFLLGIGAVTLKVLLSMVVALAAKFDGDSFFSRFQDKVALFVKKRQRAPEATVPGQATQTSGATETSRANAGRGALGDLLNPVFLASLILSGVFFFYAERSGAQVVLRLMRPVTCAFLLFYLARRIPLEWAADFFEQKGLSSFAQTFRDTLESLKKI